jgi:hypothetical protein
MSVEFHAENEQVLLDALTASGLRYTTRRGVIVVGSGEISINLASGKATVQEGWQAQLNSIKQAYSLQAVKAAASRTGWRLVAGKTPNTGQIMRYGAKSTMTYEVLEDGKISVKTGDMGGANHLSADEFMKSLEKVMGGPTTVRPNHDGKQRISHLHSHGGIKHSH